MIDLLLGNQPLWDGKDLLRLSFRLALDLTFAWIVVRFIYFRIYKDREYMFTCIMFNVITFCLSFLLRKVPIELGFALGLFAVFGILRYRTEPIRIRDLTYLFIVIGIAILNALANKKISLSEMLLANTVIVGCTALLEYRPMSHRESSSPLRYDNLELLQPDKKAALVDDIRSRTGLDITGVQVNSIDLLRDSADLTIHYKDHTRK